MPTAPTQTITLAAQTVQCLLRGETLPEPINYEQFGEYHELIWQLNLMAAFDVRQVEQLWAVQSAEFPKLSVLVNGCQQEGLVAPSDLFPVMKSWYEHGAPVGVSPGWASLAQEYRVLETEMTVITGTPSSGKALALDTMLPTPMGWTTMAEIVPGDVVFDEHGIPCRVLRVTEVMFGRPCFRLTFSDGTSVVADSEHQWVTRDEQSRNSYWNAHKNNRLIKRPLLRRGTDQSEKRTYPEVRSTRVIADSLRTTGAHPRWNHCIAVAEALVLPDRTLPVEPYVLGLWLGDGDSKAASITASIQDIPWYLNEIWAGGYYTNVHTRPFASTGRIAVSCVPVRQGSRRSLQSILRDIGVLRHKHIPLAYLRSSISQRVALLQGLMDTDGYVSPRSGRCEFTTIKYELADGVAELVSTLGWRVKIKQGQATLRGRIIGPKYRVTFTPDCSVFRLPRKGISCKSRTPKAKHRQIIAVEAVPSVPTKCIEVDSPTHQYLCTQSFIPTHNSRFLTAMLVNLARDHDWSFLLFSPEMSPPQRHLELALTQYVGKPFRPGRKGRMSWAEAEEGLQWLNRHFTWLWPKTQPATIPYLLQMAKQQALTKSINGMVIDPWNRVSHRRGDKELDTAYIGDCLGQLSAAAQTYGYHQWIVAHPTKVFKGENGQYGIVTPNLISGSANWWNMPENILSVRRNIEDADDRTTQVYIQKIRWDENGRMGRRVDLYYHPETARYSELVSQTMPYATNGRYA